MSKPKKNTHCSVITEHKIVGRDLQHGTNRVQLEARMHISNDSLGTYVTHKLEENECILLARVLLNAAEDLKMDRLTNAAERRSKDARHAAERRSKDARRNKSKFSKGSPKILGTWKV